MDSEGLVQLSKRKGEGEGRSFHACEAEEYAYIVRVVWKHGDLLHHLLSVSYNLLVVPSPCHFVNSCSLVRGKLLHCLCF